MIRNNRIDGADIGLYLGNSDGMSPFIRGVIEFNVVQHTIDYPGHQLVQMEGNVAFYNNILFNEHHGGLLIRSHHGTPREIDVFFNTVIFNGTGIFINSGDTGFELRVCYNAVFADTPISAGDALGGVTGSSANAMESFVAASGGLGALDLNPLDVLAVDVDSAELSDRSHRGVDYDGVMRSRSFAGALSRSEGPAITLNVRDVR